MPKLLNTHMNLASIRITHHKTPNEFFYGVYGHYRNNEPAIQKNLYALKEKNRINGAFLLLTCHRLELYLSDKKKNEKDLFSIGQDILTILFGQRYSNYSQFSEISGRNDSLRHLLAVSSGIDSIIVGEREIIKQIKAAQNISQKHKNTDKFLNEMIGRAIEFGYRIRKNTDVETGLTSYASIPHLAAEKQIPGGIKRRFVVIGVGMLGGAVIKNLTDNNITNILVTNRDGTKAAAVAKKYGIKSDKLSKIMNNIQDRDIIVSCVAGGPVDQLSTLANKKLEDIHIFDFGVPANLPPGVKNTKNITYASLEDCRGIIDEDCKNKKQIKILIKDLIFKELNNQ